MMIETILYLSGILLQAVPADPLQTTQETVWRNPQNSVHVRIHPCGQSMCGTVIWANAKAKADSARAETSALVGTEVFRDFHPIAPNHWTGRIFVPDMKRVFNATGILKDANTLVARGCLAKNFGCKSQIWTRVDTP